MNNSFKLILKTRENILKTVEGLSIEQLNKVPQNFNNNIMWNVAHVISAQQILCYKLSGLNFPISAELVEKYKKGTRAEDVLTQSECREIFDLILSSLKKLEGDYKNGIFNNYNAYTTSYGVELNNIEDVLNFLPVHEGLHLGYIMALKKLV
ncbi:MAG: DinB family protein [Cytophagaceae bacterium]